MAEVEVHTLDDLDEAVEAMLNPKWLERFEEERKELKVQREKDMAEAAELAKGKEAVINVGLKRHIANDLHHTRFVPLSLTEVLVFSGQARIATHKETRELSRT